MDDCHSPIASLGRSPGSPELSESSGPSRIDEYQRARELILELGVASASWLQRQLSLPRDEAARHIDRMAKEGLVSLPDAWDRREMLAKDKG
jgi:DNA segregation ATPase FtsK/SpoIIIE-like protein